MPNFKSIKKATAEQKAAYWANDPVYPLYGFIYMTVEDGTPLEVVVEDLSCWSRDNPRYEIVLPEGYNAEGCHSLPCFDQKDVIGRAQYRVEKCRPGGGCGCPIDEGE